MQWKKLKIETRLILLVPTENIVSEYKDRMKYVSLSSVGIKRSLWFQNLVGVTSN